MPVMNITKTMIATTLLVVCVLGNYRASAQPANSVSGGNGTTVLSRNEAPTVLPGTVFFRGKIASIQPRNSAGLRTRTGKLVLAVLVDTSGYSSSIQELYQAYLLTEVPLNVDGHRLPPGSYGFGFVEPNHMVAMDIGGNEVLRATTQRDEQLARPTPLQIVQKGNGVRLYLGRKFVVLSPAEE